MRKKFLSRMFVFLLTGGILIISGCLPLSDADSQNQNTPSVSVTRTVIGELSKNLITKGGFSKSQSDIITASAQGSVDSQSGIDQNNLAYSLPLALQGAESALNDSSLNFTQDERILAVNIIISSFVSSLEGRFAATTRSMVSSRAIAVNAEVVTTLLARLSKAAVMNLKLTGIESDRLGTTASSVVQNMIGCLDAGGVNKAFVSEALVQILNGAVSSLKESGLSTSDALSTAVTAITQGAIEAVPTIGMQGLGVNDYANLTNQIASGAASAVCTISTTSGDVSALVSAVAKGSSEGIISISQTLDGATIGALVQAVTEGTTSGLLNTKLQGATLDSASMIGTITSVTTKTLASVTTIDQSAVQKAVTVGVSAAAQTSVIGGLNATQLTEAIKLQDVNGNSIAVVPSDIDTGIAKGVNLPPTISTGTDQTVTLGAIVTVTGTATDDHDTTSLVIKWAFTVKPSGSTVDFIDSDKLSTTFTPDIAGTYLLELKVIDTQNAVSIVYVSIKVNKTAGVSSYLGKTAQQRLDAAIVLAKAGDAPAARDELLIILGHYTESALFANVNYVLAGVYSDMGLTTLTKEKLETAMTYADASTIIGAKTRIWYASIITWNKPNLIEAKRVANEVITARAGLAEEADGMDALAGAMRAGGDIDGAIAKITTQVLTHPKITAERKFWAHQNLAWSYSDKKNWSQALTEFKGLPALAIVNADTDMTVNQLRFNAAQHLWWFVRNAAKTAGSGVSVLVDGIPVIVALSQDSGMDAFLRLNAANLVAEYYLWDSDGTAANYQKGIDILKATQASTESQTDTRAQGQRCWGLLRLGSLYDRARDVEPTESIRNTLIEKALTAYASAKTIGWGKWYGNRPAAEAMVEMAGEYHWNKSNTEHNDTALSLLQQVLSGYPSDQDQYPKAFAQFRQGEIYRDIGNDLKDQNGGDYAASFLRAIDAFSKVTLAFYPTLNADTWFFLGTNRMIGECYMEMKNFDSAKSYFNKSLIDPKVPQGEKVWSQLYLANCLGEQAKLLAQEGYFDSAFTLLCGEADAEYQKVFTYKDEVNPAKPISNGGPSAQAFRSEGRDFRDTASTIRYDQGAADTVWKPFLQKAIPLFAQVTRANFPDLPVSEGWLFVNSISDLSDCQFQLGLYTEGRTALQNLLDDIAAGTAPDSDYWSIRKKLANSYHKEAENIGNDMTYEDRLTVQAQRITLEERAISEGENLFADWKLESSVTQDQTNDFAYAFGDMGWAVIGAMDALGWDDTGTGNNGYSAGDWTKVDQYASKLTGWWTDFSGYPSLAAVDNGRAKASLARIRGEFYQNLGYRLDNTTAFSVRKVHFDLSLASFNDAIAIPGCDNNDYGASQNGIARIKLEYARNLTVMADRKAALETAIDLTNSLLGNPDVYIGCVADSCVNLARAYRDLHMELAGQGITGMVTPDEWMTSVIFYVKAIADHTGNYAQLGNGWEWNEAYNMMHELNPVSYP